MKPDAHINSAYKVLERPPRVRLANYYPFSPGASAGPHWSESNLFLPVLRGSGSVKVGPQEFVLSGGQVLHVPWAAPLLYRADAKEPFVVIGVHLSYDPWDAPVAGRPLHTSRNVEFSRTSMQKPPGTQPFEGAFVIAPPPESPLLQTAGEIARDYEAQHSASLQRSELAEARLRGLALAFLAEFENCLRRRERPAENLRASAAQLRLVREISSFIDLSIRSAISRRELAERAGVSESTLAAAFRAVTGRGPVDYLIDRRLELARTKLATSRAPISEIAHEVGIADIFYFSKLFKRRVGCSPREYRARLKI